MIPPSLPGLAPAQSPYALDSGVLGSALEYGPTWLLVLWLLALAGPHIAPQLGAMFRALADVIDPPAKPPAAAA